MLSKVFLAATAIGATLACPDHSAPLEHQLRKRAEGQDWAYEASYDWGRVNERYELCQIGSMQSPVGLLLTQGLSLSHQPQFNIPETINGTFLNWGYGPAFTPHRADEASWTDMPSVTFEENMPDEAEPGVDTSRNETVYFSGWHIHSPADHSVGGDRSKAELHLVFANENGTNRAVFGIRIDPGNQESPFFQQLPSPMISFRNTTEHMANVQMNIRAALEEVNNFNEFWTYRGSLTSPPCTEGVRWYMARNILFVSNRQMQEILRVSTYSARAEQEAWLHAINV